MTHTLGTSGYLMTADGRRLHYMEAGAGAPTVVFESGMGFSRSTWGMVQPLIAQRLRTIVYDRSNLGRSDGDPQPRTLGRIAGDLGELLTALDTGPYLLVGHSYGGTIALVAAAADPSRIAGLVLVDHSDENLDAYYAPSTRLTRIVEVANRTALNTAGRLGLMPWIGQRTLPGMPRDVMDDLIAEDLNSRGGRGAEEENRHFAAGVGGLRESPPALGGVPVTVISGMKSDPLDQGIRMDLIAAHRRTVDRLGARHVSADRSGHNVMLTEPGLIADEVLRIAGQPSKLP